MAEADPDFAGTRAAQAELAANSPPRRRYARLALIVSVPLLLLVAGVAWWMAGANTVSTDNAYVKQEVVSVSSEIGGIITSVSVKENQQVKAGDILFTIDPAPYRIALARADADLASAQVKVSQLRTDYATSGVSIEGTKANVAMAAAELARQRELADQGFTTRARLQAAETALANAQWQTRDAEVKAEKARVAMANGSQLPGLNPQIALAMAARDKALLDLRRTVVRVPVSGRVSQAARLEVGQLMIACDPRRQHRHERSHLGRGQFQGRPTGPDGARPARDSAVRCVPGYRAERPRPEYRGRHRRGVLGAPGPERDRQLGESDAARAVRIVLDEPSPKRLLAGLSADVTVEVGAGQ